MEVSKRKQDQDQESKTLALDGKVENWSEHVEDLVGCGDTDGAISYLENLISRLAKERASRGRQLAAATSELSKLYTMKSDELRLRAFSIRASVDQESSTRVVSDNFRFGFAAFFFFLFGKKIRRTLSAMSNKNGARFCLAAVFHLWEVDSFPFLGRIFNL
jgi:hypothetical protein